MSNRLLFIFLITLGLSIQAQEKKPLIATDFAVIQTELGDIHVELYGNNAPVTVKNFMKYVDNHKFKNTWFYRVVRMDNQPHNDVKIEVIQGGMSIYLDNGEVEERPDLYPPIKLERTNKTGIKHLNGMLSMARYLDEPDSANGNFAIMVGDQPELNFGGKRNPDGQGFAAFGRVIQGMDVVKKIHAIKAAKQYFEKGVKIINIVRVKK